jgi:hypothetical protein
MSPTLNVADRKCRRRWVQVTVRRYGLGSLSRGLDPAA